MSGDAKKIIIPTGYMGSGSSAITDLISEFRGYEASNGTYEYVFMHCPDGIFDLEDKLLVGNNAVRSDEALHSFEQCMWELYHRKLWWVGNYKKKLHPDFWKWTQEYVEKLTQYEMDDYWYMQQKVSFGIFVKLCIRKILLILSAGKIVLRRPLTYPSMKISMVEPKEFYRITAEYLDQIFRCMGLGEKNLIFDQLLLPHNVWRMEHYFGDHAECFVVERDPRDVFILNKYIWGARDDSPIPYPRDAGDFCEYYKRLREMERPVDHPHVHRLHFEDLVYRYEETVEYVRGILGLKREDHIRQFASLQPKRSIGNTQLFLQKEYKKESEWIEKELAEFLYEFPFRQTGDISKVF